MKKIQKGLGKTWGTNMSDYICVNDEVYIAIVSEEKAFIRRGVVEGLPPQVPEISIRLDKPYNESSTYSFMTLAINDITYAQHTNIYRTKIAAEKAVKKMNVERKQRALNEAKQELQKWVDRIKQIQKWEV